MKILPAFFIVMSTTFFPSLSVAASGKLSTVLEVPETPAFDSADWKSVRAAFRQAPQWKFGQSWVERPSRGFRKGTVRIGWQGDRLFYLADLDDRELFTKATRRNQNLWELGDVLEIFAGVHGNPGYIEYHTAPNGVILQLFWPHA